MNALPPSRRSKSDDELRRDEPSGFLHATFAVRHERGVDVVFLLGGFPVGAQIGMGAASSDYGSLLTIGADHNARGVRTAAEHTVNGRRRTVPTRLVYRSRTAIVIEATPLPLHQRPAALKCWSFARRGEHQSFLAVAGFTSPALHALPPVPFQTTPR